LFVSDFLKVLARRCLSQKKRLHQRIFHVFTQNLLSFVRRLVTQNYHAFRFRGCHQQSNSIYL